MTFKSFPKILFFLFYISSVSLSYAEAQDNAWKFDIVPYLWALNMNGRVQVGSVKVHVKQNFDDILRQMNWGGMVWVDAYKGKFGLFANLLYADLSNSVHDGPASLNATNKFGIFSLGASYEIWKTCFGNDSSLALTPYIGARYTTNDTTVKFDLASINLRSSNNKHWTDPIVGARLNYAMTKAWLIILAGDVGGVNTTSQNSYNIMALLGYKPQTMWTNTTMYLGYRILDQRYSTGSGANYFNWNMKLFGPILGIAFNF